MNNMTLTKIFTILLVLIFTIAACTDLLEPQDDNHSTFERIYIDPGFAEGLLLTAYTKVPTRSLSFNDVATDDAVTNSKQSYLLRIATGEWSSQFNPLNQWENCISAILYINQFISVIDTVSWKWTDPVTNKLFIRRFKGEAYALRGLFQYHLLQTVAGVGDNGELLGIPLFDQVGTDIDNFNIPRASFEESVDHIYADLDKSLEYLTMDDYKDLSAADDSELEALLPGLEGVTVANYNAVFGSKYNQRISGRIVKALKARIALMAASPSLSDNNEQLWIRAANFSGDVISKIGGVSGLDPAGNKFYEAARVNSINLGTGIDQKEMIWRSAIVNSNNRERDNFPPSLFGNGSVNPTQNLVDAFPMSNGYPISHPSGSYDPNKPYMNRDPRLALYIIYNGGVMKGTTIKTNVGGGINAKDSIQSSTRTGYYLKKLLNESVNLNPVGTNTQKHYEVHMRYTEIFLIYAEAANEAWGPNGTGSYGFSAKDIIAAIRNRAGITQPDNYLSSITTKEEMRDLIRNERRLELCFEGFRFWDLRRWKLDLTEPAVGINIDKSGTILQVVEIEKRSFDNAFMHYGPLPQNEVLKYSELIQNRGW
jgi:hypothetical protein